jgi:hypothetical protein
MYIHRHFIFFIILYLNAPSISDELPNIKIRLMLGIR